jgi:hypothetical protein
MLPASFLPAGDPLAVVFFAFRHRFVTAAHVQRAFNLNSYRTAQHHVTQLARTGLLANSPVHQALNSFPNVYVATGRGVTRLARAFQTATGHPWMFGAGEQRRRGRPRRFLSIQHELCVTDVDIVLLQAAARRADASLLHVERRYDRPERGLRYRNGDGELRRIAPDAGYYVRRTRTGRRWLDLLLLEMDLGHMAWGTRMVEKFIAYEAWASSPTGRRYVLDRQRVLGDRQAATGTFRLLVVARARAGEGSDDDRLVKLAMAAIPRSAAMRRRLWLTTWQALVSEPELDSAPMWWWGKDLAAWRDAYIELSGRLPHNLSGDRERRAFVAERLVAQPRRQLFKEPVQVACYTDNPHEREHSEPDNSTMFPSWDRQGAGAYAGVWRRSGERSAPSV